MRSVRVLIVDDEEDMRTLLRSMIELANDGLSVAGEAANGVDAIRSWREDQPDVVLLDHKMPGLTGLETAERILAESPSQLVFIFSAFMDEPLTTAAQAAGVRACVSKSDARLLVERLRECAAA